MLYPARELARQERLGQPTKVLFKLFGWHVDLSVERVVLPTHGSWLVFTLQRYLERAVTYEAQPYRQRVQSARRGK